MTKAKFNLLIGDMLDRFMLGDTRMPSNEKRVIASIEHKDDAMVIHMRNGLKFLLSMDQI